MKILWPQTTLVNDLGVRYVFARLSRDAVSAGSCEIPIFLSLYMYIVLCTLIAALVNKICLQHSADGMFMCRMGSAIVLS